MNDLDVATTGLPQGDLRLLKTATARRLLAEQVVARLAYTGRDGTPRVMPVNSLWTGEELVIPAFAGTYKVRDLEVRPDVAVCIDTTDGPPQVVMLRGKVTMSRTEGVLPEYAVAQRKVMEQGYGGSRRDLSRLHRPAATADGAHRTAPHRGRSQERFPLRTSAPVIAALGAQRA